MFHYITSERFARGLQRLNSEIEKKARKCLRLLQINPRHNSLAAHKVENAVSAFGGDVFEAYVDIDYRVTWEYAGSDSKGNRLIYLRNIGNHDVRLSDP